uniref:Predicted protein n=1 Tax=Hordeum vulgare subsp. vulgare TaxID=112509 RepID=F2EFE3_HORVV|nr:predicted protein [Hordeum vulgare subsp. vulgare]
MGSETFVEILLAILLPPVGVFLRYGIGVSSQTYSYLSTAAAGASPLSYRSSCLSIYLCVCVSVCLME